MVCMFIIDVVPPSYCQELSQGTSSTSNFLANGRNRVRAMEGLYRRNWASLSSQFLAEVLLSLQMD